MNRPVDRRSDFYLFLDELQEYITPAMEDILSMGAEYRLSLIMAHQNMAQIPQQLRSSILGNAGTIICFRLGADYAALMSRQFGEKFESKYFSQLPAYEALVKVDEHTFTMSGLPPEWEGEGFTAPDFSDEIIQRCRAQYATPVQEVDKEWERGGLDIGLRKREPRPSEARLNIQGNITEQAQKELFDELTRALSQSDPSA